MSCVTEGTAEYRHSLTFGRCCRDRAVNSQPGRGMYAFTSPAGLVGFW